MHSKDETHRLEIPKGSALRVDGEEMLIESGEIVVRIDYLFASDDDPNDPTMKQRHVSIDVEVIEPDE